MSCRVFDQMLGLGRRLLVGCDDCGPKAVRSIITALGIEPRGALISQWIFSLERLNPLPP